MSVCGILKIYTTDTVIIYNSDGLEKISVCLMVFAFSFHTLSEKMFMVPASLSLKASCPLQTKSSCRYEEMFRILNV